MTLEHRYHHAYEQANRYDQEHLFTFWEQLSQKEKETLLEQVEPLDYEFLERIFKKHAEHHPDMEGIEPPTIIDKQSIPSIVVKRGAQALKEGKVAVCIVAGGQGSRLGFEGPKGLYPATPIKQKPLFQLLCEKIKAGNDRYHASMDVYIMTSDDNHDATKEFFHQQGYFGLDPDSIVFFKQQMLPAVDDHGKIVMKSDHEIALAPGGTGGTYTALVKAGLTARMREKGIDHIHYVHIDNPLIVIPDPAFVGQHLQDFADVTTKIMEKTDPEERVGIYVKQRGKIRIIEYIFMLEELLYKKDADNKLAYRAGSPGIHLITREFIDKVVNSIELPFYMAYKRVPCINKDGDRVTPLEPNAYKFESFVFDAFPEADVVTIIGVKREDEFAPIKDAAGKDSPASSKNMQVAQAKRWLEAAGVDTDVIARLEAVEVAPSFALDEDDFVRKVKPHADDLNKQLKGKKKAYVS